MSEDGCVPETPGAVKRKRGQAGIERSKATVYRAGRGAAARWQGSVAQAPELPPEEMETDPAALWPDGFRSVAEAEDAGVLLAALAARDEKRWVRGKPLVHWDAVRLQVGRGRTQVDVSKEFGVHEKSICSHAVKGDWGLLEKEKLEALSRHVAMAGLIRAALLMAPVDRAAIARSAQWRNVGRVPLYKRQGVVEADELLVLKQLPANDPDNPDYDFRGRAEAELPPMLEEAKALGDAARVAVVERRIAELAGPAASEAMAEAALLDWSVFARREQLAPDGDWRTWLLLGGRGAGKTRAGAEWVRSRVREGARRIALVGPTLHDVREVMIEGPSGLKAVAARGEQPDYSVSRRRVSWPNGAQAYVFSAEDPDSLRGPQFDAAWCDEIGAWARDERTWDMLAFALRLGLRPQVLATTTPRARGLVKRLVARLAPGGPDEAGPGSTVMTRATTRSSAHNLAPGFVDEMERSYSGVAHLRSQELEGVLVEDPKDALWTRAMIEDRRVTRAQAGEMERVVVAIDPPAGMAGDACGIVAAGRRGGVVYVLADASVRGMRPLSWAGRAVALAREMGAGLIVAEANQGGEMVREVLMSAGARGACRVKLVHAKENKWARAQPVCAAYEGGEVVHAGVHRELEDEMCAFGATGAPSPDRVDAMVWAVRELTAPGPKPGIFRL